MKKEEKINVMRILDQKKIKRVSHCYADTETISGEKVATVLKQDPNQVFKTLVTIGNSNIIINGLYSHRNGVVNGVVDCS